MSKTAEQRMNDEYIAALRDNANQPVGVIDYLAVSKAMARKLRDAYAENARLSDENRDAAFLRDTNAELRGENMALRGKLAAAIIASETEIERLREALAEYADDENWTSASSGCSQWAWFGMPEAGPELARRALAGDKGEK